MKSFVLKSLYTNSYSTKQISWVDFEDFLVFSAECLVPLVIAEINKCSLAYILNLVSREKKVRKYAGDN